MSQEHKQYYSSFEDGFPIKEILIVDMNSRKLLRKIDWESFSRTIPAEEGKGYINYNFTITDEYLNYR